MDNNTKIQLVFDTNLLVDALISRGNHYQHTVNLLEYVKIEKLEGWIALHSLPTFYYLLERTLESEIDDRIEVKRIASELMQEILTFLKILPQCGEDVVKALQYYDFDYEDYLIALSAKNYLPNPIIVSRNKMFEGLDLPVVHPADVTDELLNNIGDDNIDFANLQYQQRKIFPAIEKNIHKVLKNCNFIMGEEIRLLEAELQDFTSAKHALTCSSGTDALLLAMMAMDIQPGDEIITTPFTFIATAETIALMKAVPVFVDIEGDTLNIDATLIEAAITDKTKAIMPVSLYGQPADMDEINDIATRHNLKVIIDGAQSFGATYKGKMEVHYCDIYTTSFFPAKPLGCYGDGGAVFTNNEEYAEKIKMLRVHGQNNRYQHKYIGMGGRLDTLQAAVLLAKLPHYADELKARQTVAANYTSKIAMGEFTSKRQPLSIKQDRTSVWAQYTLLVDERETIREILEVHQVPSAVHYPTPLYRQECFQYLGLNGRNYPTSEMASRSVISLPMNPFMTDHEQDKVISVLNN